MYTDNFIDICKMVVLCTLGGTLVFAFFPLLFSLGNINVFVVASGCIGFFVGVVCPPEINPELFSHPIIYQTIAGTIAGVIITHVVTTFFPSFTPSIKALLIGAAIGGFLGMTTRFWIKCVDIPIDF